MRTIVTIWGIGGVVLLLVSALLRLTPFALEPLRTGALTPWQLLVYVTWAGFMAYSEGYRGFQMQFSPRVVRRAFELPAAGSPWYRVFGPFYCMSLIGAPPREQKRARIVFFSIVAVVCAVRLMPQPWRGVVDGGVVVGLGWGVVATVMLFVHEQAKDAKRRSVSSVV